LRASPSPIEFTASPATETQREDETSEDDDDDEDDEDDDDEDEDVVAEAGQGSEAVAAAKPCIESVVAEDDLRLRNTSPLDGRQKHTGFIDVWWLFDDGGIRLNVVTQLSD